MDPTQFNRTAWDNIATSPREWFSPCSDEEIAAARGGDVPIRLTACRKIPPDWIGPVKGTKILALAAGGGHQGPLLAAAGADVTVVDFSTRQLEIDRSVADKHGLTLRTIQADMADLTAIASAEFDLVINPCSVNFVPDVRPIWREVSRVLRVGGALISGWIHPVNYLFDAEKRDRGKLKVRFRIPYSDLDLRSEEREKTIGSERPIEFGHSLEDLLGGQLASGLMLTHLLEDRWGGDDPLSDRIATFGATRAVKV